MAHTGDVYPDAQLELAELPLLGSELVCIVAPARRSRIQIEPETTAQPLIPERPLLAGEQYRFHFDMTKCIGCKCCVVACNEQNGNPAAINWRRVGEVEGGHYPNTHRYHLSMGCNHCLEPSCLIGCPVEAYTKDPVTGVVIHSAEACIGCQYCTWNCSYGVPQFNSERGVVGKCDMCHNRLADEMAPACVAACPEGAIAIEIVDTATWRADYMSANAPGLPSAGDSISTTRVTLPDSLPPDTGRVDTQRIATEHPHWPLVFMLVLTQLAAGALGAWWIMDLLGHAPSLVSLLGAAVLAGLSLNAAMLHLGRPAYAWRALKGLRRSWLSREVLGLSLFAGAAAAYAGATLLHLPGAAIAGLMTIVFAGIGTMCSARIYMVPARPAWNSRYTISEFFSTALLLGPLFIWASTFGAGTVNVDPRWLTRAAIGGATLQLVVVVLKFLWLSRSEVLELRASALLLSGPLKNVFLMRLALLLGAGVALPLAAHSAWGAIAALVLALIGELTGALAVLRQRRAEEHRIGLPGHGEIRMKWQDMNWKRLAGIDTLQEEYAYSSSDTTGYTSARKIPEKWVATTCGYCSVGCGIEIGVKDGKAIAARPLASHPVNRGKLCPKGLSEHYVIDTDNRLRYPLLRKGSKLMRVGWDEALDAMVERFRSTQAKYGPDSLGVLSTGQLVTEEFYTLGKLVQLGFGTRNYDGNTTLCMASAVSGYKQSFGSDGPPGAYEDLEKADVILLIGANIADNHPILCQYLDANPHKTLIVADPRVSKTAMMADLHLPIKPRSDLALANGIAHILIRHGLIDRDYIAQHASGFDELVRFLDKYTPDRVAGITGLSEELLYKTAFLYGRAKAGFIGWTMGVNHSTLGALTVSALCNLALLTGNIGRPGASPFSITGQCNAMGTREAGFTSSMPAYRKFDSMADRQELAGLWNIDESRLPVKRGLAYPDIVEAAVGKKIRALWIIATNPLVSFPNQDVLRQAFSNLDFLVVQDCYHPTPTTELADLVLPAAVWGEKEGTYTNSERRVSKVNKAVDPPGEARSDFEIFLNVAQKLGCKDELFPAWTCVEDAFNDWARVSKGRLCDYSGISYASLAADGATQWPCREGEAPAPRLYANGKFPTDDGRAKLIRADWQPFPEQPTAAHPFVLNTGRTVEHWHTRTKTREVPILERLSPRAWLEMNPRDAKQLSLRSHDRVDVISQRGRVRNIELRLTEIIGPGQLFMPFHFSETNVNEVTQSAFDPISREPNYKQCAVRVEKTIRQGAVRS